MPMMYWTRKLSPIFMQSQAGNEGDYLDHLLVEVSGRRLDKVCSLIESYQGKINRELAMVRALAVDYPIRALEELARSPYITKIWHDAPVYPMLDVAVSTTGGAMIQELGYSGEGVVIAVLDTGIYPHEDLVLPKNRILAWKDFVNGRRQPYDDNGHGTHVSGIIAGNGRSSRGKYRGMAPEARLVGIKVLDEAGSGNISNVIAGIEWCLDNLDTLNIKVINLSIGAEAQESYRTDPLCRATSAAWEKGITVCAAAGNEGPTNRSINTPGINPTIITVGNLDDGETLTLEDDQLHPSSSRGPTIDNLAKPDLIAPGTNITSLKPQGGYHALTGTSMATPMVSGAVAQIIQKWPESRPDRIKSLLKHYAKDLGLGANLQGAGMLNLETLFKETRSKRKTGNEELIQQLNSPLFQMFLKLISKSSSSGPKQNDFLKTLFALLGKLA